MNNGGCTCHPDLGGSNCVPLCVNKNSYHYCECNDSYTFDSNTTMCIGKCASLQLFCKSLRRW